MNSGQKFLAAPIPRDPNQKFWDPEIQTMSPERLRSLQEKRLHILLQRVFARQVAFFKRKLQGAGINSPEDIKKLEDLCHIPLTNKQELRDSEAEHPKFGDYRFTDKSDAVRMGTSTGSTGTPTISLWTRHDLWLEYESASRTFWRQGRRPGMTAVHAHPGYLYGGGLMLSGAFEYFGCTNVWVPPPETDAIAKKALDFLMKLNPDCSAIIFSRSRFLEVAHKLGIAPDDDRIDFLNRTGGGSMHDMDKGIPLRTAGLECYAFLGETCGQSTGAHINQDRAIVQAVDPITGKEVPDGEWGSLVVTTLDRDNSLIRYNLEEGCKIFSDPCPCGETSVRGIWGGRFADIIMTQGKRLHPYQIEAVLRKNPDVNRPGIEWQMVRPTDEKRVLVIRVERGSNACRQDAEIARNCYLNLKEALGIDTEISVLPRDALPRSGYKIARVVDR